MITIHYKGCKLRIEMPDGMPHNPEDNSAFICITYEDQKRKMFVDQVDFITEGHYQFTSENPQDWQKEAIDYCKEYVDNHV